jgi:hypothetical protein
MREARRTPCSFAVAVRDVLTTGWADIDREDRRRPYAVPPQSARRVHHPHSVVTAMPRAAVFAPL